MSRAPDGAEIETESGYLEAFEQVFRLHERGKSFSGRERNCAFINTGNGHFADFSAGSGLDFPDDGRGLAIVDWDHDGDLDLWFANRTAPKLRFMRNESSNADPAPRFLRLRLEGTDSNRDAVGARAELTLRTQDGGMATLVRTLQAGEGFLSQSSKWLHYGLGKADSIGSLTIRWPSGGRETLSGIEPNRHYRIVEGSGSPIEWRPPKRRLALEPGVVKTPEPATPARVVFASRAPVPELLYRSFAGEEISATTHRGNSPQLVNLWATWCLPCVKELQEITERAKEIETTGLRVLALSVDGLDEDQLTTPADAESFLSGLDFPFAAGIAGPELLTRLQLLHDHLFSTHLELAIPTSFLITPDGRLAAVYRGALELDRLLEDTRNLAASQTRRRQLAAPLVGRWLAPVQELRLASFAQRFAEEGLADVAIDYLRIEAESLPADPEPQIALARRLVETGDLVRAVEHLRLASDRAPDERLSAALREVRMRAGEEALQEGRLEAAVELFAAILTARPEDPDALNNLALARLEQGRLGDAELLLRRALALAPDLAGALNNLGIVLARQGDLEAAERAFERALAAQPDFAEARENLEAMRRIR